MAGRTEQCADGDRALERPDEHVVRRQEHERRGRAEERRVERRHRLDLRRP